MTIKDFRYEPTAAEYEAHIVRLNERIAQLEAMLERVREWCDEVDLSLNGPYYLGDKRQLLEALEQEEHS